MNYQPQPGTIAYRAIAWLEKQPASHEVTLSIWGEAIDVDPLTLGPCLKTALDAGIVRKRTRNGLSRPQWFSLGDGKPASAPAVDGEDQRDPLPRRNQAPEVTPLPGALLPGGVRGDEPVPSAPAAPIEIPQFTEEVQQPEAVSAPHGGRPMTLSECAQAEEKPPAPRPFDVWLSGVSGEMVLQGVTVDTDGDAVLPPEWVAAVKRVLLGAAT